MGDDAAVEPTPTPAAPVVVPGPPIASPDQATQAPSDADKANAAAEAAAAAAAPPNPAARFVQYTVPRKAAARVVTRPSTEHPYAERPTEGGYASKIGVASARAEILPQHWAQLGIPATQKLVWEKGNNWRVPASRLSGEQLDYLLHNDNRFELVDGAGRRVDS
jgi:hypothetical protein